MKTTQVRKAIITCFVFAIFALATFFFCDYDIAYTVEVMKHTGTIGLIFMAALSWFIAHTWYVFDQHVKYKDFPQPPRADFYQGNWPQMKAAQDKNKLFDLFGEWVDQYGETILFWRQSAPKYFTSDPDLVKAILTEISLFAKTHAIPNRTLFGQRMTGTSSFLTVQDGELWAIKRRAMSPYFSKIHMTSMFDKCHDYIQRGLDKQFSEIALGKTHVDIVEFYGELYQFFLGSLGFDLDCNLVSDNAKFHNEVIQGVLKWAPQQFGNTTDVLKMRVSKDVNTVICGVSKLRTICRFILEQKIKEYTEKGPQPDDILHHVITANQLYLEHINSSYDSQYKEKLMTYMTDDVLTIFLVIDNMAKTMSNLLVRVMREPRVYAKMVAEIREAELGDLQKMDKSLRYTEMVILETLRLHPTLMRGIRVTKNQNTELNKGLTIQGKGMIFFGQLVLHRSSKYWKDPYEFLPERWETGSKGITPFTYLPFVAGPRVCMGKHLAMLSMKLALAYTFKNYDMKPVPGEEKDMDWDYRFTIVRPSAGYNAVFTKAETGN